jgi:hypothetical protein
MNSGMVVTPEGLHGAQTVVLVVHQCKKMRHGAARRKFMERGVNLVK